jgi:hypothetical protein
MFCGLRIEFWLRPIMKFFRGKLSKRDQRPFKCLQVPEGSRIFAHSSLKTPFSAMKARDGCRVQPSHTFFQ